MASKEEILGISEAPEYIPAFDFEKYDILQTIDIFVTLRPYMFAVIGIYLLGIYFGQKWMESRPPYKLKTQLVVWNAGLSIFSIIATVRSLPEIAFVLTQPEPIYLTVCSWSHHNYTTSFWGLMFALSKILEFGDTVFIILRKQKLIFLHWFHHIATLLLCWFAFEYQDVVTRLYIINTVVHSFMYAYYALTAYGVKIPRNFAMALTTLQISQMICYVSMNFYSLYNFKQGRPCTRSIIVVYMTAISIGIFAILFIKFFLEKYVIKRRKSKTM